MNIFEVKSWYLKICQSNPLTLITPSCQYIPKWILLFVCTDPFVQGLYRGSHMGVDLTCPSAGALFLSKYYSYTQRKIKFYKLIFEKPSNEKVGVNRRTIIKGKCKWCEKSKSRASFICKVDNYLFIPI